MQRLHVRAACGQLAHLHEHGYVSQMSSQRCTLSPGTQRKAVPPVAALTLQRLLALRQHHLSAGAPGAPLLQGQQAYCKSDGYLCCTVAAQDWWQASHSTHLIDPAHAVSGKTGLPAEEDAGSTGAKQVHNDYSAAILQRY